MAKKNAIAKVDSGMITTNTDAGSPMSEFAYGGSTQSAVPNDSGASYHVKISRSNLGNAKRTYKEIKSDDKYLGRDLRKQDFGDASFQSMRLEDAAKREAGETGRLKASQGVKAQEVYAKTKQKIANREYKDTKHRIGHERHVSKTAIRGTKKIIKHKNAEKKRAEKLERLRQKAESSGSGSRTSLFHRRR